MIQWQVLKDYNKGSKMAYNNSNGGWKNYNGKQSRGLVWKQGQIRKDGGKPYWYATVALDGGKYAVIKFYENDYQNRNGETHHSGSIVVKNSNYGPAPKIGPAFYPPMRY